MQPSQSTIESTFARSWELLTNNWIIIVPGIVIGFVVGVINYLLTPHYDPNAGAGAAVAGATAGILMMLVNLVGQILAQCYMTGMAGAAWASGKTELADGGRAFQRDAGNVLIAIVGLAVALVIAAILAIPTIGISLLLYWYFFIYTFPAAIIGERPGLAAMGDSFRIATRRVAPTLIVIVLIAVISLGAGFIGAALHFIPFIGPIIGAILVEIVLSYVTLVVVGEYLALRDSLGQPPAVV